LIAAGGLWLLLDRLGISLGHLPGDVVIERENFRLCLPITTSLPISVALSTILWFIGRW
jgi:hypothetical protein